MNISRISPQAFTGKIKIYVGQSKKNEKGDVVKDDEGKVVMGDVQEKIFDAKLIKVEPHTCELKPNGEPYYDGCEFIYGGKEYWAEGESYYNLSKTIANARRLHDNELVKIGYPFFYMKDLPTDKVETSIKAELDTIVHHNK